MTVHEVQRVVFQPRTYQGFLAGVNQMVAAVRPTLGPRPRHVALERAADRNKLPELLDDGATILRRVLELPDRDADMGAMFVRHLLWRQSERHGDGAATTAVLFQSVLADGVRYVTSGGNAMVLRRALEQGMRIVAGELERMAVPVRNPEQPHAGASLLVRVARSVCYDDEMARQLGEIFDIVGEYGYVDIRPGQGRGLEREYVEGLYWDCGLHSRRMLPEGQLRAELENAAILITDLSLNDAEGLVPVLQAAMQTGRGGLMVMAYSISDAVAALLHANSREGGFRAIAVKTPGGDLTQRGETLSDIAILTGGRVLLEAAGDTLHAFRPEDLGQARRAWANMDYFGLVGGKGDPRRLRRHIADLRSAFRQTDHAETRRDLQKRIGKLLGGTAVLHVGGLHELEVEARKNVAERAAVAVRSALQDGVVPGGGAALLACQGPLREALRRAVDTDERAAYRILLSALEAPLRAIVANAGYDPSEIMAELRPRGPGWGFDVETGRVSDMLEAGIVDAAAVQRAAAVNAISAAALALTIDVLVHHKKPDQEFRP